MMLSSGEGLLTRCRGRNQTLFLRASVITVLVLLALYTFTVREEVKSFDSSLKSRSNPTLLQNAVYKLQTTVMPPRKRKIVLLWTTYFSSDGVWLPTATDLECPVSDCDATSDRSMLVQSSAVVFHWRNVVADDLPECSSPENGQCPVWVLFNKEAATHTSRSTLELLQGKVHWTATYRRDSDLFAPYGKVVPKMRRTSEIPDFDPDRRLVCWLVSNCGTPSKREVFVKKLKNHIEVDIYGKCGSEKCPHAAAKDCYQWLSKRCKFYLSFENSNCRDYTTEKLYYALSTDMVPVVIGSSNNYEHLPPRSYINAADFSSPKELADYLVIVGKDKDLYLSYSWWRKIYEVKDYAYKWFCELCEKLHRVDLATVRPRKNLTSWWFDQSDCTT